MTNSVTNDSKDRYPLWAALSFVVVLVAIGIPVWWQTTTVKRAPLPIDEIEKLDFESDCLQGVKVLFKSRSGDNFCDFSAKLFPASVDSVKKVCASFTELEAETVQLTNSVEELDDKILSLQLQEYSAYDLVLIKVPYKDPSRSGHIIQGKGKFAYITADVENDLMSKESESRLLKGDHQLPLAKHYNFLLTLATHNAEDVEDPKIATNVHAYMTPLFEKLKPAVNFTVESQVIFFGNSHLKTDFNTETGTFVLTEDDVTSLINALDMKTGSLLSLSPTFHWVWYVPYYTQVPLQIHRSGEPVASNTVISPRWNGGGLQIINNDFNTPKIVAILTQQLKEALGLKHTSKAGVQWTSLSKEALNDWEFKLLLKQKTCEYLKKTASTLKSLVKLLSQIENIVVSDQIKDAIVESVKKAHLSKEAIEGGDWLRAYADAASSFEHSEEAFFDPSLLALLYFPDDQKYAIYIPLFLPVGIPIVLSLRSIFQQLFQSKERSL